METSQCASTVPSCVTFQGIYKRKNRVFLYLLHVLTFLYSHEPPDDVCIDVIKNHSRTRSHTQDNLPMTPQATQLEHGTEDEPTAENPHNYIPDARSPSSSIGLSSQTSQLAFHQITPHNHRRRFTDK